MIRQMTFEEVDVVVDVLDQPGPVAGSGVTPRLESPDNTNRSQGPATPSSNIPRVDRIRNPS